MYLINGSEIILDKDFDIKKQKFDEYFFKINSNKKIKIKFGERQFFAYRPKKLDYDILKESIAKGWLFSIFDFSFFKLLMKLMKCQKELRKNFSQNMIWYLMEKSLKKVKI